MSFFATGGYLGYSTLVYFTYSSNSGLLFFRADPFFLKIFEGTFFKTSVIEPDIIISAVMGQFVLILDATLS